MCQFGPYADACAAAAGNFLRYLTMIKKSGSPELKNLEDFDISSADYSKTITGFAKLEAQGRIKSDITADEIIELLRSNRVNSLGKFRLFCMSEADRSALEQKVIAGLAAEVLLMVSIFCDI